MRLAASAPASLGIVLAISTALVGCNDTSKSTQPAGPIQQQNYRPESGGLLKQALETVQNPERFNITYRDSQRTDYQRAVAEQLRRRLGASNPFEVTNPQELFDRSAADEGGSVDTGPLYREPREIVVLFNNDETLDEVVNRLSQWSNNEKTAKEVGWEADPLIETLPSDTRRDSTVNAIVSRLSGLKFGQNEDYRSLHDGWALQEVVWLRDLSQSILGGEVLTPLEEAQRLFDWTTRNIALLPGTPDDVFVVTDPETGTRSVQLAQAPMEPWLAMMTGQGHAEMRAWIFTLLARQHQLDVVMLGIPLGEGTTNIRPWLPALVHEGQLYVFDPSIGMPVTNADGSLATLEDIRREPSLVADLPDEQDDRPNLDAEQLKRLVALVEASPLYLTYRARLLEDQLSRSDRMVLTVRPSAVAERVRATGQIEDVRLWERPYRDIRYLGDQQILPPDRRQQQVVRLQPFQTPTADLWNGRVMQLKGVFSVDENRPDVDPTTGDPLPVATQFGANQYLARARETSDLWTEQMEQQFGSETNQDQQMRIQIFLAILNHADRMAEYWLGLVAVERALQAEGPVRQSMLRVAEQFLERVAFGSQEHPAKNTAIYNLGRVYELQGRTKKAAEVYQAAQGAERAACLARAARITGDKSPTSENN
jgi:hypothetical protein